MSATEAGTRLFAAINDAVKGTAINRSDLHCGNGSLLGRYAPKVQKSYRKWKEKHRVQSVKTDERIVRQSEPKPKVANSPMLGEKNTGPFTGNSSVAPRHNRHEEQSQPDSSPCQRSEAMRPMGD